MFLLLRTSAQPLSHQEKDGIIGLEPGCRGSGWLILCSPRRFWLRIPQDRRRIISLNISYLRRHQSHSRELLWVGRSDIMLAGNLWSRRMADDLLKQWFCDVCQFAALCYRVFRLWNGLIVHQPIWCLSSYAFLPAITMPAFPAPEFAVAEIFGFSFFGFLTSLLLFELLPLPIVFPFIKMTRSPQYPTLYTKPNLWLGFAVLLVLKVQWCNCRFQWGSISP